MGPVLLAALRRLAEIARRVHRDVKAVHGDVHALLNCGVLHRNNSLVVFPYDAIHVDVVLRAA
jgi:predicted transcriptional regulator